MKVLGVDPGLTGALGVVELVNLVPAFIDVTDMPTTGTGSKARVDVIAAANWIARHSPSLACVERGQSFPGQGISSAFLFGRVVGAIEAAVILCRIPLSLVEASTWKRQLHLPGKDKEAARALAIRTFPTAHASLARKRDHNRAEALLIALTGLRSLSRLSEAAE
jgi:crossover junction endodeoxyribonuclease RuvC